MNEACTQTDEDEAASDDSSMAMLQRRESQLQPALRSTHNMLLLPNTAHELIEVIGLQATIDLVSSFGGAEFVVPAVQAGGSRMWRELADGIGEDAAGKLVASRFKGTPVYVPMCTAALRAERDRQIVQVMREVYEGTTQATVGEAIERTRRKFKLTRSAIYRIFKRGNAS